MKKRILQIIPTLDRSGAEKQMVLLASHLPKDRFEVEVAVLTRTGPLAEDLAGAGIPVTQIEKRLKLDLLAYGRLKRTIRRFRPDLVHTWLFAGNAYGRQAAIACGVGHLVAGERCVDPWKNRLHFLVDRYLARKTDRIATNSSGVKDFYVRHGLPADKFVIIPNAVIPPEPVKRLTTEEILSGIAVPGIEPSGDYHPVVDSRYDREERTYFSVSPRALSRQTPFIIGIVARLWPQKRLKDALWAFETLRYVNLNFHVLIIGDGPQRETLLRFRDQWKLSERVHFLGHRDDVPRIMPSFDVMLSCSAYEGQSNSILEAMALGIPVIATDIPGNRDLVVDGETGILVPDSGEDFRRRRRLFVEKILGLLEDEPLRQRMGEAAKARIARSFSLDRMIRGYVELYDSILRTG